MDIQLKRGLLEVCVMAVLNRGDSYGYQLIKDIGPCIEISESTLYPILKRLEGSDMLTVYSIEYNSRLRKYYRLTEAGRQKIEDFKNEWKEVMTVYNFITAERESAENE